MVAISGSTNSVSWQLVLAEHPAIFAFGCDSRYLVPW